LSVVTNTSEKPAVSIVRVGIQAAGEARHPPNHSLGKIRIKKILK
jgi:hypothetical protein